MAYFLIILLALVIVIMVVNFIRDRRSLKRKTVETIGDDLWKEIDVERQESLEKGKKFRKILEEKKGSSTRSS